MNFEGTEEHFVLVEYEIEPDAEIQWELLRIYENFRSTEVEINDDKFFGRAIGNGKSHIKKHKRGVFYPVFRFWN